MYTRPVAVCLSDFVLLCDERSQTTDALAFYILSDRSRDAQGLAAFSARRLDGQLATLVANLLSVMLIFNLKAVQLRDVFGDLLIAIGANQWLVHSPLMVNDSDAFGYMFLSGF